MYSSTFFDLCPDILLEIFTYFSLNELFDIFNDLIPYLATLLNQNHLNLHITNDASEKFFNEILPRINSKQIISLNTSYLITNFNQFLSLRSMHLNLQTSSQFDQFQSLVHLKQLSLQVSETILLENSWLCHILLLPNLHKLKLDLTITKSLLSPQKEYFIDESNLQSSSIKHLEIKIPMSFVSLLTFLQHFPQLKIFRASLYRLNSTAIISYVSATQPSCVKTLQVLDLHGYIDNMSLIIHFCSSLRNLERCRLKTINVTNDDAFQMKDTLLWRYLFNRCSKLKIVKIHLLMSIEERQQFNTRAVKDLIRTFNQNSFAEKYHFRMEQRSMNRGYVTITGEYDINKIEV